MSPRTYLLLALVTTGCSHAVEQAPPRSEPVAAADPPVQVSPQPQPEPEPDAMAPQRGRPRLSQTVTLGQGDYAPMPTAGVNAQGAGQGVVINNNITVVNQQPAIYGGYYGYGLGYGVRGGAYDRTPGGGQAYGAQARGEAVGRGYTSSPGSWSGAQGTAAPGHTPGVGGNWSPPKSYGPRPMR